MKKIISFFLNGFFKLFKIQKKIVFETGRGLIDGNPKAVYDYLLNNYSDEFKIVWLVDKHTDISGLRKEDCVYYRTFKSYYHLATARYWIRSQSLGSLLKKRKGQVYIQLWHGNGAMKRMGYDINNEKSSEVMDFVKEWDYYIANDELDANHIVSATGYKGKIEILGMACFDITLKLSNDLNFKKRVLDELKIKNKDRKKSIILYAPTFRDFDLDKDVVDVPIENLANLENSIVLVRLHPLVRKKVNHKLFKYNNIINVCDYPDASDLLAICDVLITDYSSIFYQYSPLNKPIVFYPYDYEAYKELRGGFYLDYENELPGPVCYTKEDLFNVLNDMDNVYKKYEIKHKEFNNRFNYLADGNASKRFVEKLIADEFIEKGKNI